MEELFKVVVVGEVQVGKTSFVQRYSRNAFTENYRMTMGVDFAYKVLKWTDTQTIKLHLWDVAGQERYMSATKQFYRGASGCVVIYDLTSRHSFDRALLWKESIDAHASLPDGSPVPCLLLANKVTARTPPPRLGSPLCRRTRSSRNERLPSLRTQSLPIGGLTSFGRTRGNGGGTNRKLVALCDLTACAPRPAFCAVIRVFFFSRCNFQHAFLCDLCIFV
ncbi:ras-related protein Rab-7L1-like isoform X1 [Lampetra planeri]